MIISSKFQFLRKAVIKLTPVIFCCTPSLAFAGGEVSGGGNAVICRDSADKIISAELLDLFEGRIVHHLNYPSSDLPALQQAQAAAKIIDQAWDFNRPDNDGGRDYLQRAVVDIEKLIQFLPRDIGLEVIDDSKHLVLPKNCKVTQIARYEPNNTILVDSELWDHLNSQNKGALLLHEALYYYLRILGESTSQRTRRTVAHAFARSEFKPLTDGITGPYEYCRATTPDDNEFGVFFSYPDKDGSVILQFISYNQTIMISKTIVPLRGTKWPLSSNKDDIFYMGKMEGLIENDLPVFIKLTPNQAGYLGKIGGKPVSGLPIPQNKFSCDSSN
jgi:hypothetical protein